MNALMTTTPNTSNQPLTMSSKEIADLVEKRHDNVVRDIRRMLEDLDEDLLKFEGVYQGGNGESRPCYHLPKDLTLTLVAGYSTVLRKRIIDRWMARGVTVQPPMGDESSSTARLLRFLNLRKSPLLVKIPTSN